jgi:hypothetical protein
MTPYKKSFLQISLYKWQCLPTYTHLKELARPLRCSSMFKCHRWWQYPCEWRWDNWNDIVVFSVSKTFIGTDSLRLWNLPKMVEMKSSSCGPSSRREATSLVWIRCKDDPDEVLFYRTQNGYLICWKQSTTWTSVSTHWDNLQSCSPTCQILFEELHCVQLVRGHPSVSLLPLSSPILPYSPLVHMYFPHTSVPSPGTTLKGR